MKVCHVEHTAYLNETPDFLGVSEPVLFYSLYACDQ